MSTSNPLTRADIERIRDEGFADYYFRDEEARDLATTALRALDDRNAAATALLNTATDLRTASARCRDLGAERDAALRVYNEQARAICVAEARIRALEEGLRDVLAVVDGASIGQGPPALYRSSLLVARIRALLSERDEKCDLPISHAVSDPCPACGNSEDVNV